MGDFFGAFRQSLAAGLLRFRGFFVRYGDDEFGTDYALDEGI